MGELGTDERPWALVTGGSRGIGRAVAVDLAAHGWNVVVAYLRNDAAAEDAATAVRGHGGRAVVHRLNVANSAECSELVRRLETETHALPGFVHCAALGAPSSVLATRPGWWRLAWETHVGALVELVQQARSLMLPGAGVVALTSLGTHRVMPGYASIAAAKGALETLVRYLTVELAEARVNVNALCGGPVDTDSLRSFPFFAELEAESQRRLPGRIGRPDDLAPIVRFLLSPEARWIRGQVIVADGGFSLY